MLWRFSTYSCVTLGIVSFAAPQINWIGQPVKLGPFEIVHPLFHQLPVLLAPNLVHGLSQFSEEPFLDA